nr:M20/M25/M40 family metallo-hydrolase [Roseomonas marmotae]
MVAARRTGRRVCTIYFRTDTFPAGDGWTRPPFALTRQSSRLYGRGTTGMKGAVAAVWAALRAADAVGLGLSYDPVLLFCADREDGLHPGLRHLVAEGAVEGHAMCLDGPAAPRIWAGSLGSIRLAITLSGTEPDQQRPAVNPIEAMAPVVARLTELKEEIEARCSVGQSADEPFPALSMSSIHGGKTGAIWPDTCDLVLDRSYGAQEEFGKVLAELQDAVREGFGESAYLKLQTRLVGHCPPVSSPDQGPNWPRWKQALSWGFGYPTTRLRRWTSQEGSPMGFVQQAGVSEILQGGLHHPNSAPHGPDEFTTIEDVESLARAVLAYLADVTEIPGY